MLPLYACFGGLLTLLVLAALTDLRERRIPNWLTASTAALYPVYLVLSPVPSAWLGALDDARVPWPQMRWPHAHTSEATNRSPGCVAARPSSRTGRASAARPCRRAPRCR